VAVVEAALRGVPGALATIVHLLRKIYYALDPSSPEAQKAAAAEQRQKQEAATKNQADAYRTWCGQPHKIEGPIDAQTGYTRPDGTRVPDSAYFQITPEPGFDTVSGGVGKTRVEAQQALAQLEAGC
jgi:hypothetical protein